MAITGAEHPIDYEIAIRLGPGATEHPGDVMGRLKPAPTTVLLILVGPAILILVGPAILILVGAAFRRPGTNDAPKTTREEAHAAPFGTTTPRSRSATTSPLDELGVP